jgi:hypothetical protein
MPNDAQAPGRLRIQDDPFEREIETVAGELLSYDPTPAMDV